MGLLALGEAGHAGDQTGVRDGGCKRPQAPAQGSGVQNPTVYVLGKEKSTLPLLGQRDLLCKGNRWEAEGVLAHVCF